MSSKKQYTYLEKTIQALQMSAQERVTEIIHTTRKCAIIGSVLILKTMSILL